MSLCVKTHNEQFRIIERKRKKSRTGMNLITLNFRLLRKDFHFAHSAGFHSDQSTEKERKSKHTAVSDYLGETVHCADSAGFHSDQSTEKERKSKHTAVSDYIGKTVHFAHLFCKRRRERANTLQFQTI